MDMLNMELYIQYECMTTLNVTMYIIYAPKNPLHQHSNPPHVDFIDHNIHSSFQSYAQHSNCSSNGHKNHNRPNKEGGGETNNNM